MANRAPRNYYMNRHYLLRFMERLPPNGAISVFDRSWYGRVLVERVEGLVPEQRWRHAYEEIRSFEQMLLDDGMRLVKLFFHITPDVQLKRFEQRLRDPYKRWKLTYENFRNHEKWDAYLEATDEMIERTSTEGARWRIIPSNDKRSARIEAIDHVVKVLSKDIEIKPSVPDGDVLDAADRILKHRQGPDCQPEGSDGVKRRNAHWKSVDRTRALLLRTIDQTEAGQAADVWARQNRHASRPASSVLPEPRSIIIESASEPTLDADLESMFNAD